MINYEKGYYIPIKCSFCKKMYSPENIMYRYRKDICIFCFIKYDEETIRSKI
jgi:hypothetical protein